MPNGRNVVDGMLCARDGAQKKAEMHPQLVVQEHRSSSWLRFLFLSKLCSETSSLLSYPLPAVVVTEAVEGGGV